MTAAISEDLLEAVARIMNRRGLVGLSISAIAEEAGVSRVTLHRRGWTLDDYIVAVLRRASDDLRASLWPALTGPETAAVRLRYALEILCQVCDRHAGVMVAMYGSPARPLHDKPGGTTSFEFIEPFERLLRDGDIDGSLHSSNPTTDATLVANAVAWTYLHMRQAHNWDPATAAHRVIELTTANLTPIAPHNS